MGWIGRFVELGIGRSVTDLRTCHRILLLCFYMKNAAFAVKRIK